jgi:surface polysaccharide O-acyltransferase-like enzyme
MYVVSAASPSSTQHEANFFTNIWHSNYWARLLKCEISVTYWYVYAIMGLYLFIPILNKWIRNSTDKEILYFLSIWLITLILRYQYFKQKISPELIPLYFSGYIGYLVLGYYLYKTNVNKILNGRLSKLDNKRFYASIILVSFIITIFGTYFFSISKGAFSHIFYDNLSINVLFVAIGVFLFIKSCNLTNKVFIKIINFLSKYSYGIFLIHDFVLIYLGSWGLRPYIIHPLVGIPIMTLICLGCSTLIVFLVNKIPFVGKYISG